MPDGDVGSATTPSADDAVDHDDDVTRPDTPPVGPPAAGVPAAAAPTAPTGRSPRRRGRVIGATRGIDDDQRTNGTASGNGSTTGPHGVPRPGETAADGGPVLFDDAASNGNGTGSDPAARRPTMSARLGGVPDAPREGSGPVVVRPVGGSDRSDPTEPVLLVPEVLSPTAPGRPTRVNPALPDIVPASQPDVLAPPPVMAPPLVDPEPAPYDLADDDPALMVESPAVRIRRRRPRVRRVTRVIRTVDTWSVFKVALLFSAVLYISALLSGVLLWNVAYATGTVDNAERFMESFGWQTFEFHGGEIFHDAWIIGMFAAAGLTGLVVLAAATFNLVSDLVGGVRVTVLEEEMVVRPITRRRKQRIRKAPPRASTTTSQARLQEPDEPGSGLVLHSD